MTKLFIIHFQPLEMYPPVMNLIRYISGQLNDNVEIHVVSTIAHQDKKLLEAKGIYIHRIGKWNKQWSRLQRIFFYIRFNRKTLGLLRKYKPARILYYETLSAGAACLYKKLINPQCGLYVHYHEYTSPEEYKNGMFLNQWLHQLEKRVYRETSWVSHTNEYRLSMFIKDTGDKAPSNVYVVPNYPPKYWQSVVKNNNEKVNAKRTTFVYVGALSLETMYVEAFARFIQQYPDKYSWDIYSDNFTDETLLFFKELRASNIVFKGAIEYDQLPGVLTAYDIGVVLYKGHIPNYVYNAPNKLFEYIACGLDAWFPQEMIGSHSYITDKCFPEVLQVDFHKLDQLDVLPGKYREGYRAANNEYFCENSLINLTTKLLHIEQFITKPSGF
jgi:hypothetical protein